MKAVNKTGGEKLLMLPGQRGINNYKKIEYIERKKTGERKKGKRRLWKEKYKEGGKKGCR